MNPFQNAKEALQLLWRHKRLWVFGIFVAGSGGANYAGSNKSGAAPVALSAGGFHLPGWAVPLLMGGVIFAILAMAIPFICEGALIDSVRRARAGGSVTLKEGWRAGWRSFWRVLGINLATVGVMALGAAVIALGVVLGIHEKLPVPLLAVAGVVLALVLLPLLLTVGFLREYAMRFSVLEGRRFGESLRGGWAFLHGRILDSLKLLVVSFLGRLGGGLLGLVALIPAGLVGLGVYFAAGLIPAIIAGAILGLPLVIPIVGAMGAFGSAVWTLAFLDGRAEQSAA